MGDRRRLTLVRGGAAAKPDPEMRARVAEISALERWRVLQDWVEMQGRDLMLWVKERQGPSTMKILHEEYNRPILELRERRLVEYREVEEAHPEVVSEDGVPMEAAQVRYARVWLQNAGVFSG